MRSSTLQSDQLWLFDCGGVDLTALRARHETLRRSIRARRTVHAYASDWRQFEHWCTRAGRSPLPADTDTVNLYVTWMLDNLKRKITTTERHVSAIIHFHHAAAKDPPALAAVRDVIRAVKRERKEQPIGKTALAKEDVARVARACGNSVAGIRDRALIILGFATTFRRSEIANLQYSDVVFKPGGLAVLLRYSKRDQEGKGRLLGIWPGLRASTDPVRTLKAWIELRGKWAGPLFCRVQTGGLIQRKPISGEAVNEIVKRAVEKAGIDPDGYGAHSLRAGGITASAQIGRSNQELKDLSGHKSSRMLEVYVRDARLFTGRNPLSRVL
jgi:integrase